MKIVLVFLTLAVASSLGLARPDPLALNLGLEHDLNQILKRFPKDRIKHLVLKYLLNDEQFQTIVRYLNSPEAVQVWLNAFYQPEVSEFVQWTRVQLGYDYSLESGSSSEEGNYLQQLHWQMYGGPATGGWRGFIAEYQQIYPTATVQFLIQQKIAQSPVFAEFWRRLQGLHVVYDRILATPEFKVFSDRMSSLGVDMRQLDGIIRSKWGWNGNQTVVTPIRAFGKK